LIIDDEYSSQKQRRVMAGLTDDEEDEDKIPLARQQKAQGTPHTPTPPRAPTLP
jgi:hypothetical protein